MKCFKDLGTRDKKAQKPALWISKREKIDKRRNTTLKRKFRLTEENTLEEKIEDLNETPGL